jgi:hypothetical protein
MDIHLILGPIIAIGILGYLIYYLRKIEKCVCASKLPEKKYIKEWFIFQIIATIIYIIIIVDYYNVMSQSTFNIVIGIYITIVFINFINLARLFIYIKKLRELKCDCGMLKFQNFIYYDLMIALSIVAVVLIIIAIIAIYIAFNFFTKSRNKNKKLK